MEEMLVDGDGEADVSIIHAQAVTRFLACIRCMDGGEFVMRCNVGPVAYCMFLNIFWMRECACSNSLLRKCESCHYLSQREFSGRLVVSCNYHVHAMRPGLSSALLKPQVEQLMISRIFLHPEVYPLEKLQT